MHINNEGAPNQERLLPIVSIEENLSPAQEKARGTKLPKDFVIRNDGGEEVGNFTLTIETSRSKPARAYLAGIRASVRGKGYGRAAFLKIIEYCNDRNIRFESSDWQTSRDAAKVWEWLASVGKAKMIDPGHVDESRENSSYTTAKYVAI